MVTQALLSCLDSKPTSFSWYELGCRVTRSKALVVPKSSAALEAPLTDVQGLFAAVSQALWKELYLYKETMSVLTPAKLALLRWTDPALLTRAKALHVGFETLAEDVEDAALKQLLEARQAAYVVLVMALKRWKTVLDLHAELEKLCTMIYAVKESGMWESWGMCDRAIYPCRREWVPVLKMMPGSALFQELYDSLPELFKDEDKLKVT